MTDPNPDPPAPGGDAPTATMLPYDTRVRFVVVAAKPLFTRGILHNVLPHVGSDSIRLMIELEHKQRQPLSYALRRWGRAVAVTGRAT